METQTIQKNLLQVNLRVLTISAAITLLVLITLAISQQASISAKEAIKSLIISSTISFIIGNSIFLIKKSSLYNKASGVLKYLLVWAIAIIGLFLGYEVALFLLSQIYDFAYIPFAHIRGFLPWAVFSLVISMGIYCYKLVASKAA